MTPTLIATVFRIEKTRATKSHPGTYLLHALCPAGAHVVHGGGSVGGDVRAFLGSRSPHCASAPRRRGQPACDGSHGTYRLVLAPTVRVPNVAAITIGGPADDE